MARTHIWNSDPKEVQVAKVTAWQAVLVAIVSGVSGLIGAVITVHFRPEQPAIRTVIQPPIPLTIQHYISMPTGIEGLKTGESVRIVADVNGQAYSYPTYFVWSDIKPKMSVERFPLPVGKDEFTVRFTVFVRNAAGNKITEVATNENKVPVSSSATQQSLQCEGLISDQGFQRAPLMTVHYVIQ